jgi:ATP-binding cassette subfamily B multidrug efflux pump
MAYDKENYVLKGIDFKIKRGEKIGLVGTTGCGKTTTVSLLSRLYEYQKGDVLLDGHSLRHYRRSFLRQQIGFVSQDAILFRGSFRQNLSTDESVPDDKILYACEVTGLAQVMRLGSWTLESEIYDGGANLSVGERQLLALTRVLIKNPTILILDEATANIDPWFEKIIHQAVDRVMVGRTCLMIAHRLSTLDHCDRIFVFEKGRLVEEGSKLELEAKKGHFFNLHKAQDAVD